LYFKFSFLEMFLNFRPTAATPFTIFYIYFICIPPMMKTGVDEHVSSRGDDNDSRDDLEIKQLVSCARGRTRRLTDACRRRGVR
jgi:hypothetical protein